MMAVLLGVASVRYLGTGDGKITLGCGRFLHNEMLVNHDEIICDECDVRIELRQKLGGWANPLTAEAHVCEKCWEIEFLRTLGGVEGWPEVNDILKKIKYPIRTFIGRAVEDDTVQRVMEKYGIVS